MLSDKWERKEREEEWKVLSILGGCLLSLKCDPQNTHYSRWFLENSAPVRQVQEAPRAEYL